MNNPLILKSLTCDNAASIMSPVFNNVFIHILFILARLHNKYIKVNKYKLKCLPWTFCSCTSHHICSLQMKLLFHTYSKWLLEKYSYPLMLSVTSMLFELVAEMSKKKKTKIKNVIHYY